jgi:hypothetical protein
MDGMDGNTTIGGIVIPSTDPAFLAVVVGVHIPLGIACVVTGAIAMLLRKGRGRHSRFGSIYFWCLLGLFASATYLSIMRWSESYHLFVLGACASASAWFGRSAIRHRWTRMGWRTGRAPAPNGSQSAWWAVKITLSENQKLCISLRVPPQQEGRSANRHQTWSAGCDGRERISDEQCASERLRRVGLAPQWQVLTPVSKAGGR